MLSKVYVSFTSNVICLDFMEILVFNFISFRLFSSATFKELSEMYSINVGNELSIFKV